MDEKNTAAVDLLANGGQVSCEKHAVSWQQIWVDLRRSGQFWLLLLYILLFVAVPVFFASLVYVITNLRLQRGNTPIPDSALDEQLLALRLNSPWHDSAVAASQVCNTSDCVHAAYNLLFGINQTADPCHDFYDFACANWMKLYKDQGTTSTIKYLHMFISENKLIHEILMRPPESYEFQPMKAASVFFRQCVNESKTNCLFRTKNDFNVPIMHEYLKAKSNLEARAVVDQMTADLRGTFNKSLQNNNWLGDAAKLIAKKKLKALKTFIGYPNWLLNTTEMERRFEGFQLHASSSSDETYTAWAIFNKLFVELGQSELEEPWFVALNPAVYDDSLFLPSTAQAYYISGLNGLIIPMGFIQPHLFYNNTPSYVNFGRIGAVIGHEISHAFDDSQKNLDENGRFNDESWTDVDKQNYEDKSNCYKDQYNKFEILPGIFVNGSRCLNENFADNSGFKIAYLTYKEQYARAGKDHQSLPGFEKLSVEQIFFLTYGSLWCEPEDEAAQKQSMLVDTHSPGKARTNGVLQNSPEFADAWNCPVGSPMNPLKKCTLW